MSIDEPPNSQCDTGAVVPESASTGLRLAVASLCMLTVLECVAPGVQHMLAQ